MLALALTRYAELVAELLINECDQPVPDRVLRYYGHGIPDDQGCGDNGILSVWWDGPGTTAGGQNPCPGAFTATLAARWMRCWKPVEYTNSKTILFDDVWDADSGQLSDAAECVARGLMRLTCIPIRESEFDGKLKALADLVAKPTAGFVDARPIGPGGLVAGVEWRVSLGLRAEPPPTS